MNNKMEMHEVFRAQGTERAYQEHKWGDQSQATVGEYLIYIRHHLEKAFDTISTDNCVDSCDTVLSQVRKIGALTVACGQQHGMPCRAGFEGAYNFTRGNLVRMSDRYGNPAIYSCICSDEFEAIFVEARIENGMLVNEYKDMIALANNRPLPFEYEKITKDDLIRSLQPATQDDRG